MSRRLLIVILSLLVVAQVSSAQELITSTPVQIRVPTESAPAVRIIATPTVTRTPTQTTVMIEAKADAGAVNVRSEPDIDSERLGTIQSGEFYQVLGRYYRWIQFQFDTSPSGRGWVFDELVNITGDESTIPDLSVETVPTSDPAIAASTQTQEAITQTPGGLLTATAQSRFIELPTESIGNGAVIDSDQVVLPTFTYPPNIVAAAPTEIVLTAIPTTSPETTPLTVPTSVPPIVPILLLGAGGVLGLVVSSMRR